MNLQKLTDETKKSIEYLHQSGEVNAAKRLETILAELIKDLSEKYHTTQSL